MKAHLDIAHTGTLGDNRKTIVFDEDATDVLQGILIDLYTDLEGACIREIFTNARDSHVAAGQVLPVEVELPSPLRMTFVVRDRGLGLDPDDIDRIFKYGASTKRDTDEAVGMLGLGLKAPLGYTSQFTLVAVKHGLKSTVLVTRNERGGGAYDIVDTCATDEPNGVEVTIPTNGYTTFSNKAKRFFMFVEPGVVLVNGSEPEHLPGKRDLVLDLDVIVTTNKEIDTDYIVMGNVPYPVPWSERDLVENSQAHAVVTVPIGTVDFTPNREALRLTKRTLETLHEARAFIAAGVERKVRAEVSAAPTHLEALRVAVEWRASFMRFPNLRYRGLDVPEGFTAANRKQTFRWDSGSVYNAATSMSYVDAGYVTKDTTLHVVGSKLYGVRKDVKERVALYLKDQGLDDTITKVVFYPEPLTEEPWLDGAPTVDYEVIKAIKLPTTAKAKPARPKGSYRVVNKHGIEVWTEVDKIVLPAIYMMAKDSNREKVCSIVDGSLVIVEKSRHTSFVKDVPSAITVEQYMRARIAQHLASLSDVELFVMQGGFFSFCRNVLGQLPPERVLDHELRDVLILAKSDATDYRKLRIAHDRLHQLARAVGAMDAIEALGEAGARVQRRIDRLQRRYPLAVQHPYDTKMEHVLEYVNTMHTAYLHKQVVKMFSPQTQPDTGENS